MLRRRVNVSRSVTESGGLVWSTPKSWERRPVPFPAVLADELAALMVGKGRDDLVFTDLRGGVLRNSNYRSRVFEPAAVTCQKADETFPRRSARTTFGTPRHRWFQRRRQREGRAADAGARQGVDDARRVRRPVRRGSRRGCGPVGCGDQNCCGPTADPVSALTSPHRSDLLITGGAKGNRTPDLLDANETRYQLRYSPLYR